MANPKPSEILYYVAAYGPSVVPLIQSLVTLINNGDAVTSDATLKELADLASYSSAQALAAKGFKIVDGKLAPL